VEGGAGAGVVGAFTVTFGVFALTCCEGAYQKK
jgi:hypothetical protein